MSTGTKSYQHTCKELQKKVVQIKSTLAPTNGGGGNKAPSLCIHSDCWPVHSEQWMSKLNGISSRDEGNHYKQNSISSVAICMSACAGI